MITLVVLGATAAVVAALFVVLWRERRSARDARAAVLAGAVLSLWAVTAMVLANGGFFQHDADSVPPVGINLVVVLAFVLHVISLWQLVGGKW
ncbi:MAG TPA: hypothetical protein VLK65_09780 [Vicinamibacteria bacterium]|nr:hypothetical protein [Vicinamibacteria bacterium]